MNVPAISPCGCIVDFLRSCHSSRWRFFKNDRSLETAGSFYFVPRGTRALPYRHYFFSATWTKGDEQALDRLGPIQDAPRPWRRGDLTIQIPPAIPFGSAVQFGGELTFPADQNQATLFDGITEQCWLAPNLPFLAANAVTDIGNCCVVQAYARIIQLLYDASTAIVTVFFRFWLGAAAIVTHFREDRLIPAMSFVTTQLYTIVFVTGTANYQQAALQASEGMVAPSNNGGLRTSTYWFNVATLISERLFEVGANPAAPIVLAGHSMGAAACALAAIRFKEFIPARPVFLLTFGMPKIGDQNCVDRLHDVAGLYVCNQNDPIPVLPVNVIEGNWFPLLINPIVRALWAQWRSMPLVVNVAEDGTRTPGPSQQLGADVLLPLVARFVTLQPIPIINQHRIAEYIRRLSIGCVCPRWPFDAISWGVLEFPRVALSTPVDDARVIVNASVVRDAGEMVLDAQDAHNGDVLVLSNDAIHDAGELVFDDLHGHDAGELVLDAEDAQDAGQLDLGGVGPPAGGELVLDAEDAQDAGQLDLGGVGPPAGGELVLDAEDAQDAGQLDLGGVEPPEDGGIVFE